MAPTIQTLDAQALAPAEAKGIARLLYRIWPKSTRSFEERLHRVASDWRGYRGPDGQRPRYYIIWDAPAGVETPSDRPSPPQVAAMALAAPRTIRAEHGEMTILALARVCTAPEHRGKGLGARVVQAAFQLIDGGIYPFALFQTTPPVRPFYEKLGACIATNRFVNSRGEDPAACPFWSDVILRYPDGPGWPEGTIDLLGPGY